MKNTLNITLACKHKDKLDDGGWFAPLIEHALKRRPAVAGQCLAAYHSRSLLLK
jgi:hypothetical protein